MCIRRVVIIALVLTTITVPRMGVRAATELDSDHDGLTDAEEMRLGTHPLLADTDDDGYSDGMELQHGYDPRHAHPVKLQKHIEVDRAGQRLHAFLGSYAIAEYTVSTGRPSRPTPKGTFHIAGKSPRAWSSTARLWMPWWMNFVGAGAPKGRFGIHELPEWKSGKKEGEDHLGKPVSGGCIRLGVGPAEDLYAWADVGTTVIVR